MVSPLMWADVPFNNANAWKSFLGDHWLWHRVLADTVSRLGLVSYLTYPLGDGGQADWLAAHQREHVGAASSLGIAGPADIQSFNLRDPDEFASWTFLHSREHLRLQAAAGIP